MKISVDLKFELMQSRDEGKDVSPYEAAVNEILGMNIDDPNRETRALEIYKALQNANIVDGYQYVEPSDIETIKECRPLQRTRSVKKLTKEALYDRIYGVVYSYIHYYFNLSHYSYYYSHYYSYSSF